MPRVLQKVKRRVRAGYVYPHEAPTSFYEVERLRHERARLKQKREAARIFESYYFAPRGRMFQKKEQYLKKRFPYPRWTGFSHPAAFRQRAMFRTGFEEMHRRHILQKKFPYSYLFYDKEYD
jgi:hypothetical protein